MNLPPICIPGCLLTACSIAAAAGPYKGYAALILRANPSAASAEREHPAAAGRTGPGPKMIFTDYRLTDREDADMPLLIPPLKKARFAPAKRQDPGERQRKRASEELVTFTYSLRVAGNQLAMNSIIKAAGLFFPAAENGYPKRFFDPAIKLQDKRGQR